jgi:hypothetical protein
VLLEILIMREGPGDAGRYALRYDQLTQMDERRILVEWAMQRCKRRQANSREYASIIRGLILEKLSLPEDATPEGLSIGRIKYTIESIRARVRAHPMA